MENRLANPLVKCPFDPLHRVKRSRLQIHIVKCEKNHPGFVACPFNHSHRFKREDLRFHVVNCPSREATNPADVVPKIIDSKTPYPLSLWHCLADGPFQGPIFSPLKGQDSGEKQKAEGLEPKERKPIPFNVTNPNDSDDECWD